MEFCVHLQVIVRRAKNAISFSTFDYSESEHDPESLRQAKLRAEQIEMEKEWSSTDEESPPRTPSRKRVRRVGSAPEVVPSPPSKRTPPTEPKASRVMTRQQSMGKKLNMNTP